jgi:hypothetical protein
MRKLRIPVADLIRPLSWGLVGLVLLSALLTFRLGSLHTGISATEAPTVQALQSNSLSGREIFTQDSLFLPYKLVAYGLEKAGLTSTAEIRLIGVVFALLGMVAFYFILRKWHTNRVALFAGFLLATSSWFLYSARLAAPEVSYLLVPWLLYFGIRLQENNLRFIGLGAIVCMVMLLLHVPGLVLFIVPAAVWQRRRIRKELKLAGKFQSILLLTGSMVMLLPLIFTFINDASLMLDWLGMTAGRPSLIEFLKNLVGIPVQLFLRSDADPASHVGRLPYFDIATTVLIVLGVYRYLFMRKLDRAKLLAAGLGVGAVLAACNMQASAVLLPFLYIIAARGFALLLQQWFTVFPRNPLARQTGVGLLVVLTALVGYYNLLRYYVVWPHTPATKQAYSLQAKQE